MLEVARAEGRLGDVEDELFRFARAFESSDELRMTLSDASIPAERRVAIVEDLLGRKALRVSVALAVFIVSAGRGGELPEIVDRFVELAAAEHRARIAEVRTALGAHAGAGRAAARGAQPRHRQGSRSEGRDRPQRARRRGRPGR